MASAAAPPAALAGPPAAARADAPSAAAAAAAATVPSAFANNDAFERFKARWRHWTEEYGLAPDPTSAYPRHGGGGGGGTGGGHEALLASGFLPATDVRVVGSSQPMDLVAYAPADYQSSRREITRRKHVHQMADTAVKHRLAAAHHALVPVPTAAAAAMPGAARPLAGRVVRRDAATAAPLSPRSGSAALGSRAAAPGHATPRPRPRDAVVQTAQAVSQALFAAAEALPLPACSPTRADAAARGARGASRIAFADAVDVMPSASFAASDAAAAGATTGAPAVRPKSALKSAGGAASRAGSASTAPTRSPSSAAVPHVHGHAHGPDGGDGDGDGAPAAPSTPVEPALAPSRPLSSHRGGHGPGSLPGASSAASASASASRGGHFDGTGASQALDGALADGVYSPRGPGPGAAPARAVLAARAAAAVPAVPGRRRPALDVGVGAASRRAPHGRADRALAVAARADADPARAPRRRGRRPLRHDAVPGPQPQQSRDAPPHDASADHGPELPRGGGGGGGRPAQGPAGAVVRARGLGPAASGPAAAGRGRAGVRGIAVWLGGGARDGAAVGRRGLHGRRRRARLPRAAVGRGVPAVVCTPPARRGADDAAAAVVVRHAGPPGARPRLLPGRHGVVVGGLAEPARALPARRGARRGGSLGADRRRGRRPRKRVALTARPCALLLSLSVVCV
ncbi:hypothetical protein CAUPRSCDRAFT_11229 [Caulochytrium protostelioides]|uniref:Uncharacterized protein n=1 Tax=Caulochytrium protostelioides TaxID=1555241 RepID=A0A4P9WUW5_9FUNG|nr:hypothetical protein CAUPRSCDRAFT_11229 [Caulochytrium protostelioides]